MITSELKFVVDELTRLKGISSSSVYRTSRELVFKFLRDHVHGIETDNDFEFLYLYGQKLNEKLYDIVNRINGEVKTVNKWLIMSQVIINLRNIKKQLTKNGINENIIKELTNLQVEIMDVIKVIYEDETLSIFPDKAERFEKNKQNIINALNNSIDSADIRIIKPINAIIVKTTINNFKEVMNNIAKCFDTSSHVRINNHTDYDEGVIIFEK
jgi:hypothetical protein